MRELEQTDDDENAIVCYSVNVHGEKETGYYILRITTESSIRIDEALDTACSWIFDEDEATAEIDPPCWSTRSNRQKHLRHAGIYGEIDKSGDPRDYGGPVAEKELLRTFKRQTHGKGHLVVDEVGVTPSATTTTITIRCSDDQTFNRWVPLKIGGTIILPKNILNVTCEIEMEEYQEEVNTYIGIVPRDGSNGHLSIEDRLIRDPIGFIPPQVVGATFRVQVLDNLGTGNYAAPKLVLKIRYIATDSLVKQVNIDLIRVIGLVCCKQVGYNYDRIHRCYLLHGIHDREGHDPWDWRWGTQSDNMKDCSHGIVKKVGSNGRQTWGHIERKDTDDEDEEESSEEEEEEDDQDDDGDNYKPSDSGSDDEDDSDSDKPRPSKSRGGSKKKKDDSDSDDSGMAL